MRILNIHGYAGSAKNTNYKILNDAGYNVISFDIDYDEDTASEVENFLGNMAQMYEVDLIVATSFGSFFGKCIGANLNIPLIATNPCFKPSISLRAISPEYFNNVLNVNKVAENESMISKSSFVKDVIIVGDEDEVIDHHITNEVAGVFEQRGPRVYKVHGTHKLDRYVYENILLEEVKKYEKMDKK